jgi:hypothetical protein
MSAPSQPIYPASHSRGLAYKQGVVAAVEGNIAYVRTTLTETIPVRRDIMRAKGRMPEIGETWMITREFGMWSFGLILIGGDKTQTVLPSEVVGLEESLVDIQDTLDSHDERLDAKDDQIEFLTRFAYGWPPYPELDGFDNVLESISLFSSVHSVAVASAARYINLGTTPVLLPITGVRIFVSAAVAGSTIQLGLYRGPINNMVQIDTASVSSASTGMKSVNWTAVRQTVAGQCVAVGMATTASSTVAVGGFESIIITNAPKAHVAVLGATTLLSTLVMGPTTPHSMTQGRHWVGLY